MQSTRLGQARCVSGPQRRETQRDIKGSPTRAILTAPLRPASTRPGPETGQDRLDRAAGGASDQSARASHRECRGQQRRRRRRSRPTGDSRTGAGFYPRRREKPILRRCGFETTAVGYYCALGGAAGHVGRPVYCALCPAQADSEGRASHRQHWLHRAQDSSPASRLQVCMGLP